jgi:hypothetical protein
MSPDSRSRRRKSQPRKDVEVQVRTAPSADDPHDVVFFRRHRDDDPAQPVPGRDFLNACPAKVRATMRAVLTQVAAAPPKRFAGGGYWEAMKGAMTGWFEVRVDGSRRRTAPPLAEPHRARSRSGQRWRCASIPPRNLAGTRGPADPGQGHPRTRCAQRPCEPTASLGQSEEPRSHKEQQRQ